jgi:hypothetical protein
MEFVAKLQVTDQSIDGWLIEQWDIAAGKGRWLAGTAPADWCPGTGNGQTAAWTSLSVEREFLAAVGAEVFPGFESRSAEQAAGWKEE